MKKIFTSVLAMIMLVLSISSSVTATAVDKQINYKSTITITWHGYELPDFVYQKLKNSDDCYIVLDNYDIYKYFGFSEKNESFFKDNLLIVNCIYNELCVCDAYENTGITINNGIINVSYTRTLKYPLSATVEYAYDFIELKKSDVKDVDLTKEAVNVKTVHINVDEDPHETNTTLEMKYINTDGLVKKPTSPDDKTTSPTTQKPTKPTVKKPAKVTKVKLKSPKKKQLKVTWKKIKGAKYQLEYSLKKNMNNVYLKKNIKKNNVTIKKLKSNKKYYVRVRAYKTVNGKRYFGKWSKKSAKTVK